jgi:hypothetical protein
VWKNANHVDLKTLWKYLTNYLYLPRLKNEQVLLNAIAEGVGKDLCSWQENFAYASGYDEANEKYLGLKAGQPIILKFSSSDFLVKPEVASAQFKSEAEEKQKLEYTSNEGIGNGKACKSNRDNYKVDSNSSTSSTLLKPNSSTTTIVEPLQPKRRFYGSIELDSLRLIL